MSALAPLVVLAALIALALSAAVAAADATWPRELDSEKGVYTFYQPQPETFEGNVLTARSAISWTSKSSGKGPIFGVAWYTCRVNTDRDKGTPSTRPASPSTRPSPSTREAPSGLNQDARARQQGAYRSGGSSSSRGGSSHSGGRGAGGGASRGGGSHGSGGRRR